MNLAKTTAMILLLVATQLPAIDADVLEPEASARATATLPEDADVALVCIDSVCPSTGQACNGGLDYVQAQQLDIDCGSGKKKCRWWQDWEVEGEYASGTGTVEFFAKCGDEDVSVCVATPDARACVGGLDDGDDDLGCFYDVTDGVPEDISGKCVDPTNPDVVYEAIPWGLEFVAAEHVVVEA